MYLFHLLFFIVPDEIEVTDNPEVPSKNIFFVCFFLLHKFGKLEI